MTTMRYVIGGLYGCLFALTRASKGRHMTLLDLTAFTSTALSITFSYAID